MEIVRKYINAANDNIGESASAHNNPLNTSEQSLNSSTVDTAGLERYLAKRRASYNPFKPQAHPHTETKNFQGGIQALQASLGAVPGRGGLQLTPAGTVHGNNQQSRNNSYKYHTTGNSPMQLSKRDRIVSSERPLNKSQNLNAQLHHHVCTEGPLLPHIRLQQQMQKVLIATPKPDRRKNHSPVFGSDAPLNHQSTMDEYRPPHFGGHDQETFASAQTVPNRKDQQRQQQRQPASRHHSPASPAASLIQDQLPPISPRQPKSSKHQHLADYIKAPSQPSRLSTVNMMDTKGAIKAGETTITRN